MKQPVKAADEVWIATALLHREHPEREAFRVAEIVDRVHQEHLTERLRPGVQVHAYLHCVANRRPNPANYRMLYALPDARRRLFRPGDDYHEYREGGKTTPRSADLPERYRGLLDWYDREYLRDGGAATSEVAPTSTLDDLWRDLDAIWSEVPEEEWKKLPTDGSEQHDHYIYGWPKKRR